MSVFPVKNFRQALEDTKSLQSKISKYFIVECKKHNMIWIDGITEEFHRIFTSKENLKLKVNAMYAIQYFVELAEYPIMSLFQVYILPTILQISMFKSPQQNYEATSQYFASQGYSANTPNIKELSHNYIVLAQSFVFNCAWIKPYRTFQSSEMNEASQYKKAAQRMNKQNINERESSSEQQHRIQISRQQFLKNLSKFDNDSQYYVSYYMKKVQQYIIQGPKYKDPLDFKKIMKYGDVFLTSEAIGHCCQALQNNNFSFKKNALLLIHDFVLWGDIQAIMMINYAEYIENIFTRILQVNGKLTLNAGESIYPEIIGEKQSKKDFYLEFLKCLQTWAMSIPKTNFDATKGKVEDDQEFSPIFLLYIQLKNEKEFKFPQNPFLQKHKKELEQNLVINKERNSLILRQLEQNAEDTMSLSRRSIKPVNKFQKYKSKNSLIKEQRQSEFVTQSEVVKYINSAQSLLQALLQHIETNNILEAERVIQKLQQFSAHFQSKLEYIDESIDEENLQNLYREGIDRIERINCISDHFKDFKVEKINIMKLQELVKYELTKTIPEDLSSRYMEDYRSKKSKRSASRMSKSYGSASQHFALHNRSGELKNLSHDRYKVSMEESKNRINRNMPDQVYKQNDSQVSASSNQGSNKGDLQRKDENEQNVSEEDESYDFEVKDYGFQDVPAPQNKSKNSIHSSRVSQESFQNEVSQKRHSQVKHSNQNSNIYTTQQQKSEFQRKSNNSKVNFSESESEIKSKNKSKHELSHHEQSYHEQSQKQGSRNQSEVSKKESDKKENNTNGKISNSQSNPTKSKKLTENSESFMIASANLKKLNEVSNIPSSEEEHQRSFQEEERQKRNINRSMQMNNAHKISSGADSHELASFNVTNIAGFSKPPPSSVNKISSIQQKNFKFEMLNSNERQIFQDESSEDQKPQKSNKHKPQTQEDENPGFGTVFQKASNSKNSKLGRNLDIAEEIKSSLSPKRQLSKQNEKAKNSRLFQSKRSSGDQPPLIQRLNQSGSKRSKVQGYKKESTNIYTTPNNPRKESFHRKTQNFDSSFNQSVSSRKSLQSGGSRKSFKRSERSIQKRGGLDSIQQKNTPLNEYFIERPDPKSEKTSEIRLNEYLRRSQGNSQNRQGTQVTLQGFKAKEQFQNSSFAQSSQDTPKILQKSRNQRYHDEDNDYNVPGQRISIEIQRNTSPKHQKISFAQSSKNQILSKEVISERDEKEEYDRSNLTPSKLTSRPKNTEKNPSVLIKQIRPSIIPSEKGRSESHGSNPSSSLKRKIDSSKNVQFIANKELEEIRRLRERLEKVENDSRFLMEFQKSSMKSPEMPRYAISPRSPKFRDHNTSSSIEGRERVSFMNQSSYMSPQTKRNFDLNSSFSRQYLVTPEGTLIKKSNYLRYFQQLRGVNEKAGKRKKQLLKNKELLHKNENIEIGTTLMRERNRLKIIYFITPQRPLQEFRIEIEPTRKLKIKCSQSQIMDLQPKKQEKIYVNCEILEFPYSLPSVSLTYKNERKTFYLGQGSTAIVPETKIEMLLPVFFVKFIEITQISSPEASQMLRGREMLRTEEFPFNSKIMRKPHQINDFIPNLTLLSESAAVTIYCGKGCFFGHQFVFKINIKMNHFMYIQGVSLETGQKQHLGRKMLEWFLICMEELFIKDLPSDSKLFRNL